MYVVKKLNDIVSNCEKGINIQGKLLKIVVVSGSEDISNIELKIVTQDRELVYDSNLTSGVQTIYPVRYISNDFEIEEETQNIKRLGFYDYIYLIGNLGFKFSNMQEGQNIREVKVIYEGEVEE